MRHRFRARAGVSAVALASLASFFAACSSDEGDPTPTANHPSGNIWNELGVDEPERKEVRFADVKAPYTDIEGCKAFKSNVPDSHDCGCENCFDIQQQCDALPGCIEIAECGISIGCTDAYTCYLTPTDAKCVPIIDRWGNTGVASALSLALSKCSQENSCPR
jgi:hypothetical protein